MWSITGLKLLLYLLVLHNGSGMWVSGIAVLLEGQEYRDHSVVPIWQITESEPLICRATVCGGCSLRGANPKWFYPDGTEVTDSNSSLLYTTSAIKTGQTVTLKLYRRGHPSQLSPQSGKGSGLYRCRIQTSGHGVQNIYVGLYRGDVYPNEGNPIVTSVQFHLDNASADPFQSGPPVFTLTCHSTGGPATTVTWRRENTVLNADENHIMTRTLVEQSGPVYSNTLTVSARAQESLTCIVSNVKGSSQARYTVQGTNHPHDFTAVQKDATTVLVSWSTPIPGASLPPSGYRIFYRLEGGQTITTPDTGPGVREYRLTDLMPGTTYMIAMVTLSGKLPSYPTDTVYITIVPIPSTPTALVSQVVNAKSMTITWNDQQFVESYIVSFNGVTNCSEVGHAGHHTAFCNTPSCTYSLTELNEYSHYFITVTAVNVAGNASAIITATSLSARPSGPPKNVIGTAGVSTITVQWDKVDCIDRNSEIVNYSLTYSSNESNTVLVPANNMVYTIRGLRPVTNYTIELAAVNTAGQIGPKATVTLQTRFPPAPNPPTVMVSGEEVTSKTIRIVWDEQPFADSYVLKFIGVMGCSEMQLYDARNHTVYCGHSIPKCMYTLTELNEYSHYSITVTAVNVAGNASATVIATTLAAPPSGFPENVRGSAGVSTITVQWDEVDCIDRNSEIVNYSLTYTSSTENKTVLVPANNMVYTIRGLRPVTNYTIGLAAVNTAGQVGPKATTVLQTQIPPAPNPPTVRISEAELTSKSIIISWNEQPFLDSYVLSFKGVMGCSERPLQHIGSHTVHCSTVKCAYNLTKLNEYSHYSITVTAVNVAGDASATINVTTLPAPPSGPPENVRGTAGVSTITVQWEEVDCIDRNSEIVNYSLTSSVERKTVLVPADNMVYTIRGLRPETNYTIELAAVNTAGQIGPKATVDIMTLRDQNHSDSNSSSDEGSITAAVAVSVCLVLTIAVAITVAAIIAKWVYTRRVSCTTADMRKESTGGHELYSTTDCVAYGTATNRSGDCQEARDFEIPAVTSTSLPASATACEQVQPAVYEPIPH